MLFIFYSFSSPKLTDLYEYIYNDTEIASDLLKNI